MAPTTPPSHSAGRPKPLNILTIDGGGLQAISTLLILNRVLETVGKKNSVPPRKPRPCDVFDTIAGIGTGGWLAILLGRFRMDITACLSEWYQIVRCIEGSKSEELRLRLIQHVDRLSQTYGTGECLLEANSEGARTRHVFVAGLRSDGKGYGLFRTYETPLLAKVPESLLEGPANPKIFKISSAFVVTGAAKHFSKEWHEPMELNGYTKFIDKKFPMPHNITGLALDEMWAIHGTDVPLSVVVNIGPGLPNDVDVRQIAWGLPWGLNRVGSLTGRITVEQLSQSRDNIERDIVEKLNNIRPGGGSLFYRLALPKAPQGTAQNDTSVPIVSHDATMEYLNQPTISKVIDEVAQRILE